MSNYFDLSPGGVMCVEGMLSLNANRETKTIAVANGGDRPIQVGSHYHFFEVNRALRFDREESFGFRLDIPAGTAVRFEPGDTKSVTLVALGGTRQVRGLNSLVDGALDDDACKQTALDRLRTTGFES